MSQAASAPAAPRSRTASLALLLGVPLGVALLAAVELLVPADQILRRYLHHPVEKVEVVLFCCALAALVLKLLDLPRQRLALGRPVLPAWDGEAVPAGEADKYLNMARQQPFWVRNSLVGRRREAVLHFVASRRSAAELDDQMRSLADGDALALDASYGLTRFITWAIPILGFLGTVLGITGAIAGVTPEILEQSLGHVTDGLALAFDATALALGLTMVCMLVSFLTERMEHGVLAAVDHHIEEELSHRFQRGEASPATSDDALAVLIQKQADLWARSLEAVEQRAAAAAAAAQQKQQELLTAALAAAIERTLARHEGHLAAQEEKFHARHVQLLQEIVRLTNEVAQLGHEQRQAVEQLAAGLLAQGQVWQQIQNGEQHLLGLQAALQQNLATLVATGSFDKALQALVAAIHLLTSRATPSPEVLPLRPTTPGKAA